MKQRPTAPMSPEAQLLIAAERVLVPESEDVRARVLLRAQTALPRRGTVLHQPPPPQRWWLRTGSLFAAAAAGLFAAIASVSALKSSSRRAPSPAPVACVVPAIPESLPSSVSPAPVVRDSEPLSTPRAESELKSAPSLVSASERYQLELRLLQRARQAVARGDFSATLAAVAEHERYFPNGQLTEEREALRVKALRGLGRTSAADAATLSFRQRFPRSVLLRQMDGMLTAP